MEVFMLRVGLIVLVTKDLEFLIWTCGALR